jgi:4-hydroxy-tetrahydrodipicolinate synthase
MYKGSGVALVTPMIDGEIDYDSFKNIISFHKKHKTQALIIGGTTGESATLTKQEKISLVEFALEETKQAGIKVILGAGSNDTTETIAFLRDVQSIRLDGVMLITPYYNYNKSTNQRGLLQHFKTIAVSVPNLPIMLYDVPARTGIRMFPDTITQLSEIDNIVAYKDATGDLVLATEIIDKTKGKISFYSGMDTLNFLFLSIGAQGTAGVANNIVPHLINTMCEEFFNGNIDQAKELHFKLLDIAKVLFADISPIAVKEALYKMGLIKSNSLRLPLVTMEEKDKHLLYECLTKYDL